MYNFFGLPLVSFRCMMKICIFSRKAAFKINICRLAPWTYTFFSMFRSFIFKKTWVAEKLLL